MPASRSACMHAHRMLTWHCEGVDHFVEVREIAGPAVQEDQRNGCRVRRTLMNEVEVNVAAIHPVLLEGVEVLLLHPTGSVSISELK